MVADHFWLNIVFFCCLHLNVKHNRKAMADKHDAGILRGSPQFGSEPLHAAAVHHRVFLQEGKFLILHLRVFPLEKTARFEF